MITEYLPASQLSQVVSASPPSISRYFPATHAIQELFESAPTVVEYLPAGQGIHTDNDVAPEAVENLPTPHSAQGKFPGSILNWPEMHTTQVLPASV